MTAQRRWACALRALTPLPWAGNWAWGKALIAAGADPVLAAFSAWNEGVRVLGPGRAAPFGALLPVYTALLAVPVLGQRLHASHLLGGGLVAAGVVLAARPAAVRTGAAGMGGGAAGAG